MELSLHVCVSMCENKWNDDDERSRFTVLHAIWSNKTLFNEIHVKMLTTLAKMWLTWGMCNFPCFLMASDCQVKKGLLTYLLTYLPTNIQRLKLQGILWKGRPVYLVYLPPNSGGNMSTQTPHSTTYTTATRERTSSSVGSWSTIIYVMFPKPANEAYGV